MKGMFDGWTEAHVINAMVRQGRGVVPEALWGSVEPVDPVVLVLPWPPSENHRTTPIGWGKKILTVETKAYRVTVKEKIGIQHRGYAPLSGPLHVVIEFHQADKRRRDVQNLSKDLLDVLTEMHVYSDDSQIDWLEHKRFRDCTQPYIQLTIARLT